MSAVKGNQGHATIETGRGRKGLATGFTTGACAAAAAKAATRALVHGMALTDIVSTLPNGQDVRFSLHRCELRGRLAIASIIKDAGDDPDCTHGAELVAEVELKEESGIDLRGGQGVATVTKPGLGLEVGTPAINPVPRQNITAMVLAELTGTPWSGARVTISVPDGEERALKTLNARLGLLGGLSILGTTGIVQPYSTAAYVASVVQAIALAAHRGVPALVFTTGGRSEIYAMKLLPHLPEEAFIQVGDYVGIGIKNALRQKIGRVHILGMMGKLSKMADGRMMTHASASEVNVELLARLAGDLGAGADVVTAMRTANTARHVLELAQAAGVTALPNEVCRLVRERCHGFARGQLAFAITLVDFSGTVLGQYSDF